VNTRILLDNIKPTNRNKESHQAMAEPFKNVFNPHMIQLMADHLYTANGDFDKHRFIKLATRKLSTLEFKERSNQIRAALEATLPSNYRQACKQLRASLHPTKIFTLADMDTDVQGIRGWAVMPMADYVACRGLSDFDFSMGVLKSLTKLSSSEFAVRTFLLSDTERALRHVHNWATDNNYHVRRLASEGTRPRLPWGPRLPMLVNDPTPILPILEMLKDDTEEYVRRSVANSLNDIAKDHPALVASIARQWLKGADENRTKLVKHACRTLVKQGHKQTLKALGYAVPKIQLNALTIHTPKVTLGDYLEFVVDLSSLARKNQPLVIDYILHHQKANGETSPKVFKLKTIDLPPGKHISITKKHSMKLITTRTYYPGLHWLEIQVNGERFGCEKFILKL
jgi:3-methyladenine DNA glycosylase AlkC